MHLHELLDKVRNWSLGASDAQNRTLDEAIADGRLSYISSDFAASFGDRRDGVVELVAQTTASELFEVGYYYGDAKPKPIINISTQIACPARCQFCELGHERFTRSLSAEEMLEQVVLMLRIAQRQCMPTD